MIIGDSVLVLVSTDGVDWRSATIQEVSSQGLFGCLQEGKTRLSWHPRCDVTVKKELHCPHCGTQHVDEGEWACARTHRKHLCSNCKQIWQPFTYQTVGVTTAGAEEQ